MHILNNYPNFVYREQLENFEKLLLNSPSAKLSLTSGAEHQKTHPKFFVGSFVGKRGYENPHVID